jgi:hypothetical protein
MFDRLVKVSRQNYCIMGKDSSVWREKEGGISMELNRRDFLKGAAIGGATAAALGVTACAPSAGGNPQTDAPSGEASSERSIVYQVIGE